MNNGNLLMPIRGDQKFGKRLISLLLFLVLIFIVFIFIFRSFPNKYSRLSSNSIINEINNKNQKNNYFYPKENFPFKGVYMWQAVYKNLEGNDILFSLKPHLNKLNQDKKKELSQNTNVNDKDKNNDDDDKRSGKNSKEDKKSGKRSGKKSSEDKRSGKNSKEDKTSGKNENAKEDDIRSFPTILNSKDDFYRENDFKIKTVIRILNKESIIVKKDLEFNNNIKLNLYNSTNFNDTRILESTAANYTLNTSNSSSTINNNSYNNKLNEYYEDYDFVIKCKRKKCKTNFLFDFPIESDNFLIQIYFFDKSNRFQNNFEFFEFKNLIFNESYINAYFIFRIFMTIMIIFGYCYYIFKIRKVNPKFYTFEHKYLKILGFLYILYNDPLFFIRSYFNNYFYTIVFSIEIALFISFYIYFNLITSIRMNYYDGQVNYTKKNIIFYSFIIFSVFLVFLTTYVQMIHFTNPINIFRLDKNIFFIILIIIVMIFYFIFFVITYINYFMVIIKWKLKTDRTKGLVVFSFFFNIMFFCNMIYEFIIFNDKINGEITFYVMINYYIIFLYSFYLFTQTKITHIDNEEDLNNISILTVDKEESNIINNTNNEDDKKPVIDYDKTNLKEFNN